MDILSDKAFTSDVGRALQTHRKHYKKVCALAGCRNTFVTIAIGAYCSESCKAKAYRRRKKAPTPRPPMFKLGKDGKIPLPKEDPIGDLVRKRLDKQRHGSGR